MLFGGDAARLLNGSAGSADIAALTGRPLRYPFAPSKCIFHPNDPVRLFERDATTGRWFYGFSGFGTTFSRQRSANGMRSWTITCEDPLRIARRSRIALNAGIADPEIVIKGADAALRNFGFGRATDLACMAVRRGRLSRSDAVEMVRLHDGGFPNSHLGYPLTQLLDELDVTMDEFIAICDRFTNKRLFETDRQGNLVRDRHGNLTKLNHDNV